MSDTRPAPNTVTMYVTTYCSFCGAAKRYLDNLGVSYRTVEANDAETRMWLVDVTGRRTVPQIFVGEHNIGGFQEMQALDREGGLRPLLDAESIAYGA